MLCFAHFAVSPTTSRHRWDTVDVVVDIDAMESIQHVNAASFILENSGRHATLFTSHSWPRIRVHDALSLRSETIGENCAASTIESCRT